MSDEAGHGPWRRATFNGQKVWVAVDEDGMPDARGGRVPMRYNDAPGAKVYSAGASRVEKVEGPVVRMAAGSAAEAPTGASKPAGSAPKAGRGSGFGSAGTRTAAQAVAAATEARRLLTTLPEGTHVAYTDGSCRGNPGPAGAGVSLRLADGRRADASRALGLGTNNIGELTAIGMALELLDEAGIPATAHVAILSDSSYANGVLCQGWKAKANVELITGLRAALKRRPGAVVHWVAGHTGLEGNEAADTLANAGVSGKTTVRWS